MPGKRSINAATEVHRILSILHKWGIHTVGDFALLDKEQLSARLGPEAIRLWERANGKSVRLLKLIEPPESFEESFEFEHEVETSEPLLFVLRRFLQQLATRLSAIYLVAQELTFRIQFDNRESYERCFKIPQPTNDVDLLFRMLHTHLENFKSEHPIIAVSLEAKPTKPVSQQFGLFETALRNPSQLSETLARLVALLGNDRVGTPVLEETHRPDAFRIEPFAWSTIAGTRNASERNLGAAIRRFRPNIAASILLDDDRPIHLRSSKITAAAVEQRGPYFASGSWWDKQEWSRREWDLELNSGALLRCHHDGSSWKIDGIYD